MSEFWIAIGVIALLICGEVWFWLTSESRRMDSLIEMVLDDYREGGTNEWP